VRREGVLDMAEALPRHPVGRLRRAVPPGQLEVTARPRSRGPRRRP
jgi:hypothetical protein